MLPSLRRGTSVLLTVAFVALTSSGLYMLFADRFSAEVPMHEVHNAFGTLMALTGVVHVVLNWRPLMAHLRYRWAVVLGAVFAVIMVVLMVKGFTRRYDPAVLMEIDRIIETERARASSPRGPM